MTPCKRKGKQEWKYLQEQLPGYVYSHTCSVGEGVLDLAAEVVETMGRKPSNRQVL